MTEIDPDARVWVAAGISGHMAKCLHVEPGCRNLQNAHNIVEKRRRMYHADQPICEICSGAYDGHGECGRSEAYEILQARASDD